MQILIDNKRAYIKKGSTFQFITENMHFTGSDSYTLSITFPLKDCKENFDIFGHINRCDVKMQKVKFDCSIMDKGFLKHGIITVTGISDTEVKTQFLEGRSVQNYEVKFDEIYINELQLGSYDTTVKGIPNMLMKGIDEGQMYVPLPWVNNSSGNLQNALKLRFGLEGDFEWDASVKGLSYQPYLIYIIRLIGMKLGYWMDTSQLEHTNYWYLLICNTLPYAWGMPQWEKILPHWTVTEFFEQLGYLLGGDFIIDHKKKTVKFEFVKSDMKSLPACSIENVVDSYSAEVSEENKCTYIEKVNMKFADCDHQAWKAYSCDWFIRENEREIMTFDTLMDLDTYIHFNIGEGYWYEKDQLKQNANFIFYVKEVNTHFVFRCYYCEKQNGDFTWWQQLYILMPTNVFGERYPNAGETTETIEIKCVPVWIDNIQWSRWCIFLDVPEYDGANNEENFNKTNDNNGWNPSGQQMPIVNVLLQGEKEKHKEFYDKLYLAFWDGKEVTGYHHPFPIVDYVTATGERSYIYKDMSLRLKDSGTKYQEKAPMYDIDTTVKYTFSFLADEIPNVRSLFYIKGQRYLCEKITATFTEDGMSQLLKGIFSKVK